MVALTSAEMAATAIQDMWVRGAPLIGVVAAYGIALGMNHDASDMGLQRYYDLLIKTRPTAINLKWALDRMIDTLKDLCVSERKDVAWALAAEIAEEDVALCEQIGLHGAEVIREIAQKKPAGSVVNILTHCNAGWLATVDWGTALSPIYKAHENGILFTSGWMKRGHVIRADSRHLNWAHTVFLTPDRRQRGWPPDATR